MQDAPTMILADKKGAAYEFAETIYEKLNSNNKRRHRYKLGHVDVEKFSDGEIYAEIKDSVRGRDCFFIQDSKMTPKIG